METEVININHIIKMVLVIENKKVQIAQAARHLATGWTAWVRSRVSEWVEIFFTPSYPDSS